MSQKNRNYAEKFLDLRIRKELKEYGDEAYVAYEKHIGKIPVVVLPDGNTREDLHNSKVDAYRHAYTSGTIAMQYGSLNSNFLGQFYEIWGDLAHKQDSKEKGMDIWNLGGSVGGHDKEGLTKATIGLGDVTIVGLSEVPDGVNRDVSSVQEMETNYDVQTIKPYFTNQDIETLIDGLIRKL